MNQLPWDAQLARWLVTPFRDSRVTPNYFTSVRLATGIGAALLFATGEWNNSAAWLFAVSMFFDHTDGELARIAGKGTRFGHLYDLASDFVVMLALFVGIGFGLSHGPLDGWAVFMGLLSGLAVATIFHFRNELENQHGKSATKQPDFFGFETEDVLYLLPLIAYWEQLQGFLLLSAIGTPIFALLIIHQYRVHLRKHVESP